MPAVVHLQCLSCFLLLTVVASVRGDNWPRDRGADGSAVSLEKGIPTVWNETDYEWVTKLPGKGRSSPVIWDQDLFVTAAGDEGGLRYLVCLDSDTGKIKWSRGSGVKVNPKQGKNGLDSSTLATDGERVYVAFADGERVGLAAYDYDGNLVWQNGLGPILSPSGQAVSPIVFEDLVIMPDDQEGSCSIVAYDRRDGRRVWSSLGGTRRASHTTPSILELAGRKPQLICLSGASGISSLDPWSGEVNWLTAELQAGTSPIFANGFVFAISGQEGKGVRMLGVDPKGSGLVEAKDVKFRSDQEISSVLSAVTWEDSIFLWTKTGFVICLDTKTQTTRWHERVGGNFSGSPVCINGRLYCIEESGKVIVVNAGTEFRRLGENPIGDPSDSTPAVANGRLYLRSHHQISSLRAKSVD